jgi:hypothetical protein
LNESPPSFTGIAAVNSVPEPGPVVLAGVGLLAMWLGTFYGKK